MTQTPTAFNQSELNLLTTAERELLEAAVRACSPHNYNVNAAAPSHNPSCVLPSCDIIEAALRAVIIGQDHAARAVAETLAICAAGLDLRPGHPHGVFLFTGPSGVGKTEFARCLASVLTGREGRFLRLDCSEYSEPHQVSRLIGAPPSYLGYGAPLPLEDFLREPGGVLLFDEFEKADPALHRLCLQIFDAGRLTTSAGKVLDLSRLTVVATTNVRSEHAHGPIGFRSDGTPATPMAALGHVFASELLNRFDRIVAFRPIGPDTARRILRERLLPAARERVRRLHGIDLKVEPAVEDLVIERGYSEEFGARHLQRAFSSLVLHAVAKAFLDMSTDAGLLVVRASTGEVYATPEKPGNARFTELRR